MSFWNDILIAIKKGIVASKEDINAITPSTIGALSSEGDNHVNGNMVIIAEDASARFTQWQNSLRSVISAVYPDGLYRLHDNTNGKTLIQSLSDGTTTFNGTLSTKPRGTYTGTAAARTVATGGIGNLLLIWDDSDLFAFVTPRGAVYFENYECIVVDETEIYYENGALHLSTTGGGFNTPGSTYNYQVI